MFFLTALHDGRVVQGIKWIFRPYNPNLLMGHTCLERITFLGIFQTEADFKVLN